jgi:hypothetical protein
MVLLVTLRSKMLRLNKDLMQGKKHQVLFWLILGIIMGPDATSEAIPEKAFKIKGFQYL